MDDIIPPAPACDTINISSGTAYALSQMGIGEFQIVEGPDRMAYVVHILKHLNDWPEWFPHGKWATIQSIESQVERCAFKEALELNKQARPVSSYKHLFYEGKD